MKKNNNGFTLMEMLIVVAVVVILVAVSIPIFASQLDKARDATCSANRRSLKALLVTTYMTENTDTAVDSIFHKSTDDGKEFTCPKKGKLFYELEEPSGIVHIYCSFHDANPKDNIAMALEIQWDKKYKTTDGETEYSLNSYLIKDQLKYIDSGAGQNSNYSKLIENEVGESLKINGVKTWTITNTKNTKSNKELNYTWSTYDVNSDEGKQYKQVPAISYNTVSKKYTVGLTNVTQHEKNPYNVIAHSGYDNKSEIIPSTKSTTKSFDTLAEAQAYYNNKNNGLSPQ